MSRPKQQLVGRLSTSRARIVRQHRDAPCGIDDQDRVGHVAGDVEVARRREREPIRHRAGQRDPDLRLAEAVAVDGEAHDRRGGAHRHVQPAPALVEREAVGELELAARGELRSAVGTHDHEASVRFVEAAGIAEPQVAVRVEARVVRQDRGRVRRPARAYRRRAVGRDAVHHRLAVVALVHRPAGVEADAADAARHRAGDSGRAVGRIDAEHAPVFAAGVELAVGSEVDALRMIEVRGDDAEVVDRPSPRGEGRARSPAHVRCTISR